MKGWFKLALLLILSGVLGGCNTNPFRPSTVTFTAAQLQTALAKKFPIEKQYLNLIDLTVDHPEVSLSPATNRVIIQLDAGIIMPGHDQQIQGKLNISSELVYDPGSKSVILKDPRLEAQQIDGVSSVVTQVLNQLAAVVIEEKLDGASVYKFNPDDLRFLGMRLVPERIEITGQGIVIHIVK